MFWIDTATRNECFPIVAFIGMLLLLCFCAVITYLETGLEALNRMPASVNKQGNTAIHYAYVYKKKLSGELKYLVYLKFKVMEFFC